jgi:hypothetical protein
MALLYLVFYFVALVEQSVRIYLFHLIFPNFGALKFTLPEKMFHNHILESAFLAVFRYERTEIFFESLVVLLFFTKSIALSSLAESRKSGIRIFVTILKSAYEARQFLVVMHKMFPHRFKGSYRQ